MCFAKYLGWCSQGLRNESRAVCGVVGWCAFLLKLYPNLPFPDFMKTKVVMFICLLRLHGPL